MSDFWQFGCPNDTQTKLRVPAGIYLKRFYSIPIVLNMLVFT